MSLFLDLRKSVNKKVPEGDCGTCLSCRNLVEILQAFQLEGTTGTEAGKQGRAGSRNHNWKKGMGRGGWGDHKSKKLTEKSLKDQIKVLSITLQAGRGAAEDLK